MGFNLLSVAVKNLRRKSFRTVVLINSIALLVAILVFGASFIISVGSSIKRAADRLGADLLVVPVGARDFAETVLLETANKTFYMDGGTMDRIKKINGVDHITHHTYLSSITGLCCDIPEAKIVAFDQDTDFIVKPWLQKVLKRRLEKGEAIIGHLAHVNLGMLDLDSSVLFNKKFKIVGVLDRTDTGLDNAVFMSEENVDEIIRGGTTWLKPGEISLIFVKLKPGFSPEAVGRNIEGEMVEVDVIERNNIGVNMLSTLKDINRVFLITMVLSCVLSASLVWSVFSAIVSERVREVGIMRALGAKGGHIVRVFILEVLILGALGSAAGIAAGMVLSASLSKMFVMLREFGATMSAFDRIEVALIGLIAGLGICLIGSVSSIMRMKGLDPHESLKEL